jgi:TolB protein
VKPPLRALAVQSLLALLGQVPLAAQDTLRADRGVRVGITYTPGRRLTALLLGPAAASLDSVRAIVARDLDHSDRLEVLSAAGSGELSRPADLVVVVDTVRGEPGRAEVRLEDALTGRVALRRTVPAAGAGAARAPVHSASDAVVRAATGEPGIAATALLLVQGGRLVRVDPDGENRSTLPSAGRPALSPAWDPRGARVAYTAFVRSGQPIVIQDLATGAREVVPGTEYGLNITPEFSRDGRWLAFAHGNEAGTDVYVYDVARSCCRRRLTVGRFSDNLSPTWSPDASRLAFISNRPGSPQLYVMAADGTGQEVLGRFDFGATGPTSAPAWSPDGGAIAFHREVNGDPQIFVLDVTTRAVRQLTGSGRNEDPTWAPDGRHLAFVSDRGGSRQLWVVDLDTGRLRPVPHTAGARLPAWSPSFSEERP